MKRLSLVVMAVALAVGLVCLVAVPAVSDEGKPEVTKKKIGLDDCPKAVKDTIVKEAGDNKVKEVEEITEGDQKTYEASWMAGGKEVEIVVAADGKLLSRKVEDKDEDD